MKVDKGSVTTDLELIRKYDGFVGKYLDEGSKIIFVLGWMEK